MISSLLTTGCIIVTSDQNVNPAQLFLCIFDSFLCKIGVPISSPLPPEKSVTPDPPPWASRTASDLRGFSLIYRQNTEKTNTCYILNHQICRLTSFYLEGSYAYKSKHGLRWTAARVFYFVKKGYHCGRQNFQYGASHSFLVLCTLQKISCVTGRVPMTQML